MFRDTVYKEMKERTQQAVLQQIKSEREGEHVDYGLLRDVLAIFQEVGMGSLECYENDFEQALLAETGNYYRRTAMTWIEEDSTPDYMIKAEDSLRAEESRVESYLHVATKPKLLKEAEMQLLGVHQTRLLEKEDSGCAALLKNDKRDDLARMYRLFGRIPKGLDPIAYLFRRHIEVEGMKLVQDAALAVEARREKEKKSSSSSKSKDSSGSSKDLPEHTFIRQIVELQDVYMNYVCNCFGGSSIFHKALKEAFESFCNKQVGDASPAELMASFCDLVLRKGSSERLSLDDLDNTLDKVVKLLAYVSDKDMFAEFYRKKLGRRLLNAASASEDAEKGVLTRLKQQCGQQFTSKMEGMVQDMQLAKEKEKAFGDWLRQKEIRLPIEMTVTVLTTGFWPSFRPLEVVLPESMMTAVEQYTKYHEEVNNKTRRLTWLLGMGSVNVRAFFDKPYDLAVQPSQATVLAAFNDVGNAPLSFSELQNMTRLGDEDLNRVLFSFTMGKHKILLKSPKDGGKSINKTDSFSVNESFSDRARRIKIPLPPADDRRKVQEEVDKDRKYAIDAAIVRIMKSRRALSHSSLIMEVVQQLQRMFQPDVKVIKRSIEGLIEREYLERDHDNHQMYKYVA